MKVEDRSIKSRNASRICSDKSMNLEAQGKSKKRSMKTKALDAANGLQLTSIRTATAEKSRTRFAVFRINVKKASQRMYSQRQLGRRSARSRTSSSPARQ